jgi:hypothetical protein
VSGEVIRELKKGGGVGVDGSTVEREKLTSAEEASGCCRG